MTSLCMLIEKSCTVNPTIPLGCRGALSPHWGADVVAMKAETTGLLDVDSGTTQRRYFHEPDHSELSADADRLF